MERDDGVERRRRRTEQQDQAAPAAKTPGAIHQQFGQPFVRDPGVPARRERERVGSRDRSVRRDPLAGRDMPPGIAIGEGRGQDGHECERGEAGQ